MRKVLISVAIVTAMLGVTVAQAATPDLMAIYNTSLQNDPVFKQALATRQETLQDLPLSVAKLLPQLSLQGNAVYTKTMVAGHQFSSFSNTVSRNHTITRQKNVGFTLTLSQTIFNFTNWMDVASAQNSVKSAYATYTFSVQDLMQRSSAAYFDVLKAGDNLRYSISEKIAFYHQYKQALESYRVGVKTLTDVYNAKAAYDGAVAEYVQAVNNLADQRENLRAITGQYYPHIATLKKLPLIKPTPSSGDAWATKAVQYNWKLTGAHFTVLAAKDDIKSAFGGHLPTLDFQTSFQNTFSSTIGQAAKDRTKTLTGELNLNLPIYSGGSVTAQVRQAIAKYDLATAQMQESYRTVLNDTRQGYLGVISGISKVLADEQSVISNRSSYYGTYEGYKVGTQTMINVLTAEKALYEAERQLADDRYAYILSLISLKENAGTLTADDLREINTWLHGENRLMQSASKRKTHLASLAKGTEEYDMKSYQAYKKKIEKTTEESQKELNLHSATHIAPNFRKEAETKSELGKQKLKANDQSSTVTTNLSQASLKAQEARLVKLQARLQGDVRHTQHARNNVFPMMEV